MSALWLLMGLLLLSYLGSFLVGGRAIRGMGLPSGAEYVGLGFLLGPSVLGLLERSALVSFEPVANVVLGWLMFVIGVTYGTTGGQRVRTSSLLGGWMLSLFSGGATFGAAWLFLAWRAPLSPSERLLVAGGIGAVSAETTRYAVRWVVERHQARGPLSELIGELAETDDLVPVLAAAVLFAREPMIRLVVPMPWWGWVGITCGLGIVLGGMAALLLGRTFRVGETWGVLLGISLLSIGIASRLGVASISVSFLMGVTLSTLSPHRRELRAMLTATEHPMMLPALVLAGAHLDFLATRYLPYLIAVAVLARVLAKWLAGLGIGAVVPAARGASLRLGLGLLPAGALAMSIGLAFALRFPGHVGNLVLAVAAGVTLFGEFVGPASLRAVLARAGETMQEVPSQAKPAAVADVLPEGGAPT